MSSLLLYDGARAPKLPVELFCTIIQYVGIDRPTLIAIALCGDDFLRDEAQCKLYNSVVRSSTSISDSALHVSFLTQIIQNQKLALLVRRYHSLDVVYYEVEPLWSLMRQALRCMIGLKEFHFRTISGLPAAELLVDAPFRLTNMCWENHSEGQTILTVLEQQTDLTNLCIELKPSAFVPTTFCQKLKSLAGNRATLDVFLPGRQIEDVVWSSDDYEHDCEHGKNLEPIKTALRKLKRFSFGGPFSRPHLDLVVNYLERVERLELVGLFPNETDLLPRLTSLREFVLSFGWGKLSYSIPQEFDGRGQLVEHIFASSSCLSYVFIACPQTILHGTKIRYERWARETAGSPPVATFMELPSFTF